MSLIALLITEGPTDQLEKMPRVTFTFLSLIESKQIFLLEKYSVSHCIRYQQTGLLSAVPTDRFTKCSTLLRWLKCYLSLIRRKGNVNLFKGFDPLGGQGVAQLFKYKYPLE